MKCVHDLRKCATSRIQPLSCNLNIWWAMVRDEAGREAEVYLINIESGWEEEHAPVQWRDRINRRETAS